MAGCEVFDESGEKLGVLSDVLPTKSNDIWVVTEDKSGKRSELLVPALKTIVKEVDTAAKKIIVRLPEGLRELPAAAGPDVPAPEEGFED